MALYWQELSEIYTKNLDQQDRGDASVLHQLNSGAKVKPELLASFLLGRPYAS
jgi:hypothetical protein